MVVRQDGEEEVCGMETGRTGAELASQGALAEAGCGRSPERQVPSSRREALHKRASVEKLWAPRWPNFCPQSDIGTRGGNTRPQRGDGVRMGVQCHPMRGEVRSKR